MPIERIPITSRAQWFELRRQDITASDVAAICGLSPYKSALRVWAEKCGEVAETAETAAMRRGRWLEISVIAALAEERPDWSIRQPHVYIRDPEERIGATVDAIANSQDGETIVQCKVVSRPVFEAGWQDGPPIAYQLQTLTEAMLWDAPRACLAALVIDTYSAELEIFPVERHAGAEAKIRETVAGFWADVAAGRQPAADYSRDSELLQVLYRPKEGVEPIDLSRDNRMVALLAERDDHMSDKRAAEDNLDAINGEIIHKLNGSPVAICNGWKVANSITHRKETVLKATSYPVLRVTRIKEKAA
jgi:putative phage-type endonuclease